MTQPGETDSGVVTSGQSFSRALKSTPCPTCFADAGEPCEIDHPEGAMHIDRWDNAQESRR